MVFNINRLIKSLCCPSLISDRGEYVNRVNPLSFHTNRMLSLFLFPVALFERITNPIGPSKYIRRLTNRTLSAFVRENPLAVIFHAAPYDRLDFANFAIRKNSPSISFAVAPRSCKPIAAYRNGRRVQTAVAPTTPIGFALWCKALVLESLTIVLQAEVLRQVFNRSGIAFIGIDVKERSAEIPAEYPFYAVSSAVFRSFEFPFNVTSGLYAYRSSDRQFLKVTHKPREYLRSHLVDLALVNVSERPFFGGFFLNERTGFENESALLTQLAMRYRNVYFSLYSGGTADYLAAAAGFLHLNVPLFALFRSNESEMNHWVLSDFSILPDILAGKIDYIHASGPKTSESALVYNDYEAVLGATPGDKLVLFTTLDLESLEIELAFQKFRTIVNGSKLHFFTYDIRQNEFPPGVPANDAGAIVLYPEGGSAILYEGPASVESLLHFVLGSAVNDFDSPDDFADTQPLRDQL
jgi:hypothetical protein